MTADQSDDDLWTLAENAKDAPWLTQGEMDDAGFLPDDAAFIAAANPTRIRDLIQRVRDAERWKALTDSDLRAEVEKWMTRAATVKDYRDKAEAYDRLVAELADLAAELESGAPDGWDGDWARDRAAELRALLDGDTSALDERLAEERERIEAVAAEELISLTNSRKSAAEWAARIARAGGEST